MNQDNIAIVGAIANYAPDEIKLYVNSIVKSGFVGKKIMLVYDVPQSTIDYLKTNGWEVYQGQLQQHVIIQRFYDMAKLLESMSGIEHVIWTDVRDVIFQYNIADWLSDKYYPDLVVIEEGLLLKDEEWAVINCGTTFPEEWERIKNNESICTGIIVGGIEHVCGLFKEMYRWSITSANPAQLADQAALNVLMSFAHFDFVVRERANDGLGVHMGVLWQKKDSHRDKLTQDPPKVTAQGKITVNDGARTLFPCIVHQYDRDPVLKRIMEKVYG